MLSIFRTKFAAWTLALGLLFLGNHAVYGQATLGGCVSCGHGCQKFHCPPPFHHCMEGKPRLKFRHGCPRPICNPCDMPHFGYFQPCWRPWPFPPNWSHCPYPTPAAQVLPGQNLIDGQQVPHSTAIPNTQPIPIPGQEPTQMPLPRISPPVPGI